MDKISVRQYFRPFIIFFIIINGISLSCGRWLDAKNIDHIVLMYANLILFLLAIVASFIHVRAMRNNNPHAFVRSVTMASFIKLTVIAVSVLIYLVTAGENRSIYAVAAAMAIYIVYTILEVNGAIRMNRKRNAEI